MATKTYSHNGAILLTGTGSASGTWNFTISDIPSGATINSVNLTFSTKVTYGNNPGNYYVFWGTTTTSTYRIWNRSGSSSNASPYTVDITSRITGNQTVDITFQKTARDDNASVSVEYYDISVVIDYTVPYTKCEPPTNVKVDPDTCAPDGIVTLSWSGAKAGTSNPIRGYHIYRASSETGSYSILCEVTTTETYGSTTVRGPSTNGSSYYYKIVTLGTADGYDSTRSTAYNELTCSYTSPGDPTNVKISRCFSNGENVKLSWTASKEGVNNRIVKYKIQYFDTADNVNFTSTTHYQDASSITNSLDVPPPEAGYYRTYVILAEGTISGTSSNAVKAPTRVHLISDVEFTDETLTSGETRVKAVHMSELQALANRMKMCYKVTPSASVFTDIVAGKTGLDGWSDHVSEIRNAVDNLGVGHSDWISIASNKPSAAVIRQLRDVLLSV
jgi:hypothetical protein